MSRTVEEMLQFPLKLHFFCHGLKHGVHTEKNLGTGKTGGGTW